MGTATVMSPVTRKAKSDAAAQIYNRANKIGRPAGETEAVHPLSHHDTLLLTRTDHDALFARLDPELNWIPDAGHVLRGGQVMVDTLTAFRGRIRQVHLKELNARDWGMLVAGVR
jgi:sugar phosphate isomerase/epimerase